MKGVRCFVVDLDGVVYKGSEVIPGADRKIAKLREKGKLFFLTNNSSQSRASYVKKLEGFGIPAIEEEIITSGYVAARYVKSKYRSPKVFLVGEEGLREEMELQGIKSCWSKCDAVVVGIDRKLNYAKIALAMKMIRSGAEFIATNKDNTLITESGQLPGAGAVVSAIETASQREPTVVGKPSRIMAETILGISGVKPEEILVIGDRLETDIAMGKNAGMKTALVLTGYAKKEDIASSKFKPDYVLDAL
ncbi:MAG: HAD-IIA family hydrolase [Candidatus Hydrothermarchaeaceae archaeon]